MSIIDFMCERHRIPARVSSSGGRFDPDLLPYQREVLEAFNDPAVEWLVGVTCSQWSKSTSIEGILNYICQIDPGPTMWILPDKGAREDFVAERLTPLVESNPGWKDQLADGKRSIAYERATFKKMTMYNAIPVASDLSQKSIRYIIIDELDKLPKRIKGEGDPVTLADDRTRWWLSRKILCFSTPGEYPSNIWKLYETTDCREWWVDCPRCSEPFVWEWEQVRFPRDEGVTYDEHAQDIRAGTVDVYYECKHCKGRIEDIERVQMNNGGRWIAKYPERKSRAGFHGNAMMVPQTTFRDLAARWMAATAESKRGNIAPVQTFIQQQLGKPFRPKRVRLLATQITERVDRGLDRGVVPEWADFLVSAADIQRESAYWVVQAWSLKGPRCHVVDWGHTEGRELTLLDPIIDRLYPQKGTEKLFSIWKHFEDSGDGERTDEVYRHALKNPKVIRPCKGASSNLSAGRYTQRSSGDGTPHQGLLYIVDTTRAKDLFANMLKRPPGDEGGVSFAIGAEEDRVFQQQMTNQERKTEVNSRGIPKAVWTATGPDHYADAGCSYAPAAATLCPGFLEEKDRQKPKEQTRQKSKLQSSIRPDGQPFLITER